MRLSSALLLSAAISALSCEAKAFGAIDPLGTEALLAPPRLLRPAPEGAATMYKWPAMLLFPDTVALSTKCCQ